MLYILDTGQQTLCPFLALHNRIRVMLAHHHHEPLSKLAKKLLSKDMSLIPKARNRHVQL